MTGIRVLRCLREKPGSHEIKECSFGYRGASETKIISTLYFFSLQRDKYDTIIIFTKAQTISGHFLRFRVRKKVEMYFPKYESSYFGNYQTIFAMSLVRLAKVHFAPKNNIMIVNLAFIS